MLDTCEPFPTVRVPNPPLSAVAVVDIAVSDELEELTTHARCAHPPVVRIPVFAKKYHPQFTHAHTLLLAFVSPATQAVPVVRGTGSERYTYYGFPPVGAPGHIVSYSESAGGVVARWMGPQGLESAPPGPMSQIGPSIVISANVCSVCTMFLVFS